MMSVRFRIDREPEFDPEIQIPIEVRFDVLPINIPTLFRTKQLELIYTEENPLVIMEMEEELIVGDD